MKPEDSSPIERYIPCRNKSLRKKSAIDSLDDLWKLERQLDAINQHTRVALAQVRQAIRRRDMQGIKEVIKNEA